MKSWNRDARVEFFVSVLEAWRRWVYVVFFNIDDDDDFINTLLRMLTYPWNKIKQLTPPRNAPRNADDESSEPFPALQ